MPHITLDGNRFHWQQTGQGPDVVLIHAATGNLAVWMFINLPETLASEFRVTSYDLRGHGASDAPATGYTSAEMAGDLKRLHAALGLGPAFLVGHSFGAVIAMHAAVLYPEIVRGLILSDPFFPGLADIEPNLAHAQAWQDLHDSFRRCGLDLGYNLNFTRLFEVGATLTAEQLDRLRADMGPESVRWLAQLPRLAKTTCGRDMFEPAGLSAERIGSVHQPVVALYDEFSSFQATRRFLEANLANCTCETVPGAKHLAPVQNPAEFVRLVQKHLRHLASNQQSAVSSQQSAVSNQLSAINES